MTTTKKDRTFGGSLEEEITRGKTWCPRLVLGEFGAYYCSKIGVEKGRVEVDRQKEKQTEKNQGSTGPLPKGRSIR